MRVRDALPSDLQARISILRSILCKQVTLESSVAGSILIGLKEKNKTIKATRIKQQEPD